MLRVEKWQSAFSYAIDSHDTKTVDNVWIHSYIIRIRTTLSGNENTTGVPASLIPGEVDGGALAGPRRHPGATGGGKGGTATERSSFAV